MTSHALGELAGSRQTLLRMHRRADAMAAGLKVYQICDSVNP